jgi:hypothetical protein
MKREYRIIQGSGRWLAQLRFTAPDDELRAASILPGWHTIKASVRREVVERAVELAMTNKAKYPDEQFGEEIVDPLPRGADE